MTGVFDRKNEQVLHALIVVLIVLPFVADLMVPLGVAVWVIYLLPIALAYLAWRPQLPLGLAALRYAGGRGW